MKKPSIKKDRHQTSSLEEIYKEQSPNYEALREEAHFIASKAISEAEIKIHSVESRIKELGSLSKKISSGNYDSIDDIHDIVGIRIICLFKSDLKNIHEAICRFFTLIEHEDKIESSNDSFGYMSVHYVCKMRDVYIGPRYDTIRDLKFEIQVRTLCMHAWAAISHYLDYKAEWDIPDHLKKGLNALSGLFYVADSQYEQLYASRQESKLNVADASPEDIKNQPINLDTVQKMLRDKFPDRRPVEVEKISLFVKELQNNNYKTIGEVEKDIDSSAQYLKQRDDEEKKKHSQNNDKFFFADLGAARISLKQSRSEYTMMNMRLIDKN